MFFYLSLKSIKKKKMQAMCNYAITYLNAAVRDFKLINNQSKCVQLQNSFLIVTPSSFLHSPPLILGSSQMEIFGVSHPILSPVLICFPPPSPLSFYFPSAFAYFLFMHMLIHAFSYSCSLSFCHSTILSECLCAGYCSKWTEAWLGHREERGQSGVSCVPEGIRECSSPQSIQDNLESLVYSRKWPEGGPRR